MAHLLLICVAHQTKMNKKRIINFTKRYNKNKAALYNRKCDSDYVCQEEYLIFFI